MKLFKHSSGSIIAFGFDMVARKADPHRISWSDTDGETWEATTDNAAGFNLLPHVKVAPEFIMEVPGKIVAYQSGLLIEMHYLGFPLIWGFTLLRPDAQQLSAA